MLELSNSWTHDNEKKKREREREKKKKEKKNSVTRLLTAVRQNCWTFQKTSYNSHQKQTTYWQHPGNLRDTRT